MTQQNRLFLLCSNDPILAEHLEVLLQPQGRLIVLSLEQAKNPIMWEPHYPNVCFLDFIADDLEPKKFTQLTEIIERLRLHHPSLPLVALGSLEHAQSAIHALRCGVNEFVDPGVETEVLAIAQRMLSLSTPVQAPPTTSTVTKHIVIMGVRPGVGATLLSAHLSTIVQEQQENNSESSVLLADMGWPYADSLVYLGLTSQFHLNDALHNLHRLDSTLLKSALAQTRNHVSVLNLPNTDEPLSDYSSTDLNLLIHHLTKSYSTVITDLAANSPLPLLSAYLESCDQIWLVCDQSMTSLVSLSQTLDKYHSEYRHKIKLILNKYNPQIGLKDNTIANQFNVELLATLPDQSKMLLQLSSQGKLMSKEHERNPYYQALTQLGASELKGQTLQTNSPLSLFKRFFFKPQGAKGL